jgi:P27 family predicted phage terminase small subunit
MSSGRKPKTTDLLRAQGNFRKDRHGDRIDPNRSLSESPVDWLTDEEKIVWEKWYEYLQRNDILKETDEVAFGLLCKVFVRVQKLGDELPDIEKFIITHTSDAGAKVKKRNPLFDILSDSENKLLKLLTEFGMTPVSRAKVKAAVKEKKNPISELRNRGNEE